MGIENILQTFNGIASEDLSRNILLDRYTPKVLFLIKSGSSFLTFSITAGQAVTLANLAFRTASLNITLFYSPFMACGVFMFGCNIVAKWLKFSEGFQKGMVNGQNYLIKINRVAALVSIAVLVVFNIPGMQVLACVHLIGLVASFSSHSAFMKLNNIITKGQMTSSLTERVILKQKISILKWQKEFFSKLFPSEYETIEKHYFAQISELTKKAFNKIHTENDLVKHLSLNLDAEEGKDNLVSLMSVSELSRVVQYFEIMETDTNIYDEASNSVQKPLFFSRTESDKGIERHTNVLLLKKLINQLSKDEQNKLLICLLEEKKEISDHFFADFDPNNPSKKQLFNYIFNEIVKLSLQYHQGLYFTTGSGTNCFMKAYADAVEAL